MRAPQPPHGDDAAASARAQTPRLPVCIAVPCRRSLCQALDFLTVLGVGDAARVSSHRDVASGTRVFARDDDVRRENGGLPTGQGFCELSAWLTPRIGEDIPSRQRARYRRRYAMVADLAGPVERSVPA